VPAIVFGFLFAGLATLAVAWLPVFLRYAPVSLPLVAIGAGWGLFGLRGDVSVLEYRAEAEVLTEVVLVIAVMGAGIRIDRPFAWRRWASTWRLLGLVMPLSIAAIAAAAMGLLGLPLASAILLGGMLAPTDPVLASNVQVGPPGQGGENEIRFGLTSEAGLNDGLAFPFVSLGLLMATRGADPGGWAADWALEVAWKLGGAVAAGVLLGGGLVHLNRVLPRRVRLVRSRSGLAAIGITFLIYAVAEALHTYGFVAVFVGAVAIRNTSDATDYHRRLNDFAEEIERLSTVLVLVFFGGALGQGLLEHITWADVGFAALVLLLIRPLAVAVGFAGSPEGLRDRAAFGFFGIRGLGSLFYAAYATNHLGEEARAWIWPTVGLVVLSSAVLYGVTGEAVMRLLERDAPLRSRTGAAPRSR
jgi:NhaP-type Na+/H+ or K+/H+ antiporter